MKRFWGLSFFFAMAIGGSSLAGCGSSDSTPLAPPGAPTGLTATPASGAVGLTWTAASGATSYAIYRADATGLLAAKTKLGTATSPAYTDATVVNGTPYFYQVTAANGAGESAGSDEATATPLGTLPPAAPAGVTATATTPTWVTLTWSSVPTATSYNIYWATTPGVTKGTGTKIALAVSPQAHFALTTGTTYYYVVTAVNGNGESADSLEVSATPSLPKPYIYAQVISWGTPAPTGVPVYDVEVCTNSSCFTPVTDATVKVSGTTLAYDGFDEVYTASSPMAPLGSAVSLTVTIPAGSVAAAGTYRASATMYSTHPTVTSPTSGATWSRSSAHSVSWTAGAPTSTNPASLYVVGIQDSNGDFYPGGMFGGPVEVPTTQTSYMLPASSLPAPGTYIAWVGIVTAGLLDGSDGVAIPDTQPGSGLFVGAVSPMVGFTAN